MTSTACPQCHTPNRLTARFCQACGAPLTAPAPPTAEAPVPDRAQQMVKGVGRASKKVATAGRVVLKPLARVYLPALPEGTLVKGRYRVRERWQSHQWGNLYRVVDQGQCWRCRIPLDPTGNECPTCHSDLFEQVLLLTEQGGKEHFPAGDLLVKRNLVHPHLTSPRECFTEGDRTYLVSDWPRGTLLRDLKVPREEAEVARWGLQLAQALAYLHSCDVFGCDMTPEGVVVDGDHPRLFNLAPTTDTGPREGRILADLRAWARLMTRLLGRSFRDVIHQTAPSPILQVVMRAWWSEYSSAEELVRELETGPRRPSLRYVSGTESHVGKKRTENEDHALAMDLTRQQKLAAMPIGLYIVADGMGGQAEGERASKEATRLISKRVLEDLVLGSLDDNVTAEVLASPQEWIRQAVVAANAALYERVQASGVHMGTTITLALLIGDTAYIANVGDSRTYLLRDKTLRPLTIDHSVVASLALAGLIQPDEVYTHPRRNELYRSLGDKPQVEVDTFTEQLRPGDQLLLCSDGLWEMVRDPQIRDILLKAASPQAACRALVRAANDGGGVDNITAIVVRIE